MAVKCRLAFFLHPWQVFARRKPAMNFKRQIEFCPQELDRLSVLKYLPFASVPFWGQFIMPPHEIREPVFLLYCDCKGKRLPQKNREVKK